MAVLILFICLLLPLNLWGQVDSDSVTKRIQDVDVVVKRINNIQINNTGRLYWNMSSLETMPHVLGSSDPLRNLQLLPGINTNNDYTSGLCIQGCSPSQSRIEVDGAPVFYPSHLLGLFSVFTSSHFRGMSLVKNRHDAASPNQVGGVVTFAPLDSLALHPHLSSTFSMIQSEGTFTLPLSRKSTAYFSARGSYLNLLYGNLLKADDLLMNYGLQDYNVTWQYVPNDDNRIRLTAYYGLDNVKFIQDNQEKENLCKWYNAFMALNWLRHLPFGSMQQTFFTSRFQNSFFLNLGSYYSNIKSSIQQSGYRINLNGQAKNLSWKLGLDYNFTYYAPLSYDLAGSYIDKKYDPLKTGSHEASWYANIIYQLSKRWTLDAGLRMSFYKCNDLCVVCPDPRITWTYQINRVHSLNLYYGRFHQFTKQIELSNGGFPIDYWNASTDSNIPQEANSFALDYLFCSVNHSFELSLGLYAKLLKGQNEMNSNLLDILLQQNTIEDNLLSGKGINYGFNVLLKRETGRFTGWIGYTFGYSLRKFNALGLDKWFLSDHDRRHDLTIVANYRLNEFITLSGNFVYATGTPYTSTHHVYLINNTLVSEYGAHNGSHLPATHRLDLSMTYYFKKHGRVNHSINFSVYNVYAKKNELFRFLNYTETGFYMRPVYSLCRVLPSVGYSIKF